MTDLLSPISVEWDGHIFFQGQESNQTIPQIRSSAIGRTWNTYIGLFEYILH